MTTKTGKCEICGTEFVYAPNRRYLAGTGVKTTPLDNKYIPVICGGAGLVLGLVALYAGMPEFPAADPITAAAVGAVSGLAATGINQAVKQLGKTE